MKRVVMLFAMLCTLIASTSVLAAEAYINKVFGQIGQAAVRMDNGTVETSVFAEVSVDGSGINQTAFLWYVVINEYTNGDIVIQSWQGDIPVDTVQVTGVASMSVEIDTCTVSNVAGCGYVDFAVTTEPGTPEISNTAFGWNLGGIIYRSVGARQVRAASSVGTVLDYPLETSSYAFMSKASEIEVIVTVGN